MKTTDALLSKLVATGAYVKADGSLYGTFNGLATAAQNRATAYQSDCGVISSDGGTLRTQGAIAYPATWAKQRKWMFDELRITAQSVDLDNAYGYRMMPTLDGDVTFDISGHTQNTVVADIYSSCVDGATTSEMLDKPITEGRGMIFSTRMVLEYGTIYTITSPAPDTENYIPTNIGVTVNSAIQPGDVIVGLSSTGQATYEKKYNGGMGSNGLTSARHDVFSKYLAEKYPESYDKAVPDELVYSGTKKLTDPTEVEGVNAGQMVLSPTRTYAPVIKRLLDELRPEIHGMVHCTGGAQTKVLHFVNDNCKVVKDNMFPVPPLFKMIHEESGTDWKEMYQVFNMGHRMEIYVRPEVAEKVIAISKSFNIDAQVVGHIEEGKKSLTIKSEFGEFNY